MSYYYLATPYSKYPGGPEAAFQMACRQAAILIKAKIPVYCPIAHTHPIAVQNDMDPFDHGIWLPAGVPQPIVRKIYGEVAKAVATAEVKKMLADGGLIPIGSTPEEFADFLKKDVVKQADVIKKIGLEPQ